MFEFFKASAETTAAATELNRQMNERLQKQMMRLLCKRIDERDVESTKLILNQYPDLLNGRNKDKDTPLICAVYARSESLTAFLLSQPDIDVNLGGEDGTTPLMWAAERGCTDLVKQLLDRQDIDVNKVDDDGDTALILAVEEKNVESVRLLLQRDGMDVHQKNKIWNRSAVTAAEALKDGDSKTQILDLLKAHSSFVVEQKVEAAPAAQEVVQRRRRTRTAPAATQEETAPVEKDTLAGQEPAADNPAIEFKSQALRALAAKYPYPHSLAFLQWADRHNYKTIQDMSRIVQHNGRRLNTSTLMSFIMNKDALKGRDLKVLAICNYIGYSAPSEQPQRPKASGSSAQPETPQEP